MKVNEIREILERSEFKFHLCGSRYLHTAEPDSDWDYVVTSTPEIQACLRGIGFLPMVCDTSYQGSYVVAVYENRLEDGIVQVSCEVDSKYKRAIMTALNQNADLRKLDRSLRKQPERDDLWETLYQLAGFVAPKRDDNDFGDF